MDYAVFILLVLIVALVLFYISAFYGKRQAAAKKLIKIKSKWGRPVNARRNFDLISALLDADNSIDKLLPGVAADIDLKNVFNYLDRTNSKPGKQYLYKKLHFPETDLNKLVELDNDVQALNADVFNRELIELELSNLNNTNAYYIPDLFLKQHEQVFIPLLNFYIKLSPILILGLIASAIVIPNPFSVIAVILLFLNNIALHYNSRRKISAYTCSLPQVLIMQQVAVALARNKGIKPHAYIKGYLNNLAGLKRSLFFVNVETRLINSPSDLAYPFVHFFKILFLIDQLTYTSSIKHISLYQKDIEEVYNYVAEIDMLIAIQSVRDGLPYYSKPQFVESDASMEITDLYHCLVDKCVTNSIYTGSDRGALITGSNMSGKTTFIKSIAVNTLLAQTIYTSCTKAYKAPFLKLQTSIKTNDDIEQHASYFQAQASAILNIVNRSNAYEPVKSLVIIDEIFRGTNTIERIAAAKSVLSHITANGNFVFVSTHDLELAELLNDDFAIYSFEESNMGKTMVFDYRLKQGLLKNNNGIAILQSMGYPDTVIDDANMVSESMMMKYLV